MLDQRAWDQIADVVSAKDFYRADHKLIFRAISELVEDDQPADAVTVGEHLGQQGKLDAAGGLGYLAQLFQDTPSAASAAAVCPTANRSPATMSASRATLKDRQAISR